MSAQREIDRRARVQRRRVEERDRCVFLLDEKRNLRAAEDRSARAACGETAHDRQVSRPSLRSEDVLAQFRENGFMDELAVGWLRNDRADAMPVQSVLEERELHREARAEE